MLFEHCIYFFGFSVRELVYMFDFNVNLWVFFLLSVHVDDLVAKGRKYCCPVCGRFCNDNHNLAEHIRTHTGEKPYKCPMCDRGFAKRGNMKAHMATHLKTGFGNYISKSTRRISSEDEN